MSQNLYTHQVAATVRVAALGNVSSLGTYFVGQGFRTTADAVASHAASLARRTASGEVLKWKITAIADGAVVAAS